MANEIQNLNDLFIEQGRELYNASLQEQKELQSIKKEASNPKLCEIIERELKCSMEQSKRLEEMFNTLNVNPKAEKTEYPNPILSGTKNLIDRTKKPEIRDAAIINAMQRINHNKITGFGSLTSYAKEIGQPHMASNLHLTLDEEKAIDNELSRLAEMEINKKALPQALK